MNAPSGLPFSAYVISLGRTPQRLERFRTLNEPTGIAFEAFKAVDGRTLKPEMIDPSILKPGTAIYTRGSLGSAISHRMLWRQCAAGDTPFLICEDDAALRADASSAIPKLMADLPAGWDMILAGYNTDTFIELDLGAGVRLRFGFPQGNPKPEQLEQFTATRTLIGAGRLVNFFGLCAYILAPEGARRLLAACFPLDDRTVSIGSLNRDVRITTLDGRINSHLAELHAYAAIPPIALPDNDPGNSAKS